MYTIRYPRAKNRFWSDQEDHEERGLVDPTVTRSTIRADVDVAIVPHTISKEIVPQTISKAIVPQTVILQKQILNPSVLSMHSL
ncbi:hypothetical protein TNCV_3726161 [Trichonephila clavipes]|nr:hypothetical protein TNCV_3726161 [Trichonephila clavipes]